MKILVSGGTGLVGKELGKKLSDLGHELIILTRNPDRSKVQTPYPHTAVAWDATKGIIPSSLLKQIDGVINLAGTNIAEKRWSENYKSKIFNSRVIGTQNLVRAVNDYESNIKFFISTSAIGFYGEGDDLSEDDFPGKHFISKVCTGWESPIENHLNEKIRSIILRVGVVLSEKGGALSKLVSPIQMGIGGPLGNGQHNMSWIDIEDLVDMYIYAVNSKIKGTYNAVAPSPVTNKELTQSIAQVFNKKATLSVPKLALKIATGEMSDLILMNQKVSSQKIIDSGFEFKFKEINQSISKRVPYLLPTEKRVIFEQWLDQKQEDIFSFFTDIKNLEIITPPWVKLQIFGVSESPITQGTKISYGIKINGIPLNGILLIDKWEPSKSFCDLQEKGPYKKWEHWHSFDKLANGTIIRDQIDYIIPGKQAGPLLLNWKIYSDLQNIFDYRQMAIYNHFHQ